jgi:Glycosyltransferase family 87
VKAFAVGSSPNRLLRFGLGILTLIMCVIALHNLLTEYPWGVDVVIPLKTATRWLAGGQPYLASSFLNGPGYDLPFLYPPFVLPFAALFTSLPQTPVIVAWFVLSVAAATFACRRLAIPWPAIPLLFLWSPFTEGLLSGNVQVVIFAAFVAFLWRSPRAPENRPNFQPLEHDPADDDRSGLRGRLQDGILATAVGALKASQVQPWLYLLRRNWRAAVVGALAVGGLAILTLPILGTQVWFDWLAQLGRANDPTWILAGAGIARSFPWWVGDLVVLVSMALVLVVPNRHAGAWIGLLAVIGSPSLRVFGLLFALPAMLLIRREIALIAGLLIATYTFEGWWLAIGLVTGSLLLGRRLPWLLEPRTEPGVQPIAAPDAATGGVAATA